MDCIGCGEGDVYNRVIVNQVSSEEVALFCEGCESKNFGDLLDNPSWHQENGCAFCDNAGTYKMPHVECLIEANDGSIEYVEYAQLSDDVAICEMHLRELIPNDKLVEELMPKERSKTGHLKA